MKRILRFLSLVKNFNRALTDAHKALCNYMANDFPYIVFKNIMPVKSQCFNTKIYIFERYSTWRTALISVNTSQFIYNKTVLKPILQKK
jgi:hypothetical protein